MKPYNKFYNSNQNPLTIKIPNLPLELSKEELHAIKYLHKNFTKLPRDTRTGISIADFSRPNLFKREFKSIDHGFTIDAVTKNADLLIAYSQFGIYKQSYSSADFKEVLFTETKFTQDCQVLSNSIYFPEDTVFGREEYIITVEKIIEENKEYAKKKLDPIKVHEFGIADLVALTGKKVEIIENGNHTSTHTCDGSLEDLKIRAYKFGAQAIVDYKTYDGRHDQKGVLLKYLN